MAKKKKLVKKVVKVKKLKALKPKAEPKKVLKPEVESKPKVEPKKEPLRYGGNKMIITSIKDIEINGKKVKEVHLANGSVEVMSECELNVRLSEGRN